MKCAVICLPISINLVHSILREIAGAPYEIIFFDRKPRLDTLPPAAWPANARPVACDPSDFDGMVAALMAEGCNQVLSIGEGGLAMAARLRDHFGFAGHGAEDERYNIDKTLMRETLRAAGLSTVGFRKLTQDALGEALCTPGALPAVVKPVDLGGSICVQFLNDPAEVPLYLQRIRAHPFCGPNTAFTVEDYVGGAEFSLEGQLIGGTPYHYGITEKRTTGIPYFVETGHSFFPQHPILERFEGFFRAVFVALRMTDCPYHVEFKLDGDRIEIIELHARYAGDLITELVRHAAGRTPFLDRFNRLANGALPNPPAGPQRIASIEFAMAAPGWLEGMDWPAGTAEGAEILQRSQDIATGTPLAPMAGYFERPGWVIFAADDRAANDRALAAFTPRATVAPFGSGA